MLKGFKDFIMRGNVVDLAVGIVIGSAFTSVVNSLVKDIMTPFIGALFKQPDFSGLFFTINSSKFTYGSFINNIISFLIVAAAVYFFVVLPINKLSARMKRGEVPPEPNTKKCPECLSEIPLGARRCPHCTTILIK
jgi:large conductance mechanosensitive channel